MVTKEDALLPRDDESVPRTKQNKYRNKFLRPSKIVTEYNRPSSPPQSPRSPSSMSGITEDESRDDKYRPQRPQMTPRRVLRAKPKSSEPTSHTGIPKEVTSPRPAVSGRTSAAVKHPTAGKPAKSGKSQKSARTKSKTRTPRSKKAQKSEKRSEKKSDSTKTPKARGSSMPKRTRPVLSPRSTKGEPLLSQQHPRVAANGRTKQKSSLYRQTYNPPSIDSADVKKQAKNQDVSLGLTSPLALAAAKRKARAEMEGRREPPDFTYSIDSYSMQKDKYVLEGPITHRDPALENETMDQSEYTDGVFSDTTRDFTAKDTYEDTVGNDTLDEMMGTFSADNNDTKRSHRSLLRYRFSTSLSENSSFGDGSIAIKQQVAWGCIGLSAVQFAILTTQVLLCGFAALSINPTVGPYPDAFSEWGGKNTYLLVEGEQYFRYITPVFLHVGYLHLFVNVFFQLETCAYLEREWGFLPWISIYLISGVGSCIAASAIDSLTIGVCSSGALMGMFGARVSQAILWTAFESEDEVIGQGAIIFERLGGTVCSAAVVFFLTFLTFIDWSGHLGGLFTGFLVGLMYFAYAIRDKKVRFTVRCSALAGMLLGGLALELVLYNYAQYDEELKDACNYFRNLYTEDYSCECQAFS